MYSCIIAFIQLGKVYKPFIAVNTMNKIVSLEELSKSGWRTFVDMNGQYAIVGRENHRLLLKKEGDEDQYRVAYSYKAKGYRGKVTHLPENFEEWLKR